MPDFELSKGLTTTEAKTLQEKYGRNTLPIYRKSVLTIFLTQFKSTIVILLLIVTGISWAVNDVSGAIVITIIILVNAVLGFVQESRAEKKLYDVSTLVQPSAMVKRDGVFQQIPREEVVNGDLVQLTPGTIAPADMTLRFAEGLAMDESSITGESYPVEKSVHSDSKVEMGTLVVRGMGEGIVIAIGKAAILGEIVNLAETGRPTNFEKEIKRLSELCLGIIVLTAMLLFLAMLILAPGKALSVEFIIFILAISVGILPETLPLIATVALSSGAMKLARMGVVVRNLSTIRDLGSMTVLCSDKTGTLTENTLKASETFVCDDTAYHDVLAIIHGLKNSLADPFQEALRVIAHQSDTRPVQLLHTIPFNATKRSARFIVHIGERDMTLIQGAYEVIRTELGDTCTNTVAMEQWIREHESKGQRILTFATVEGDRKRIAAIIAFIDPVRSTAWKALNRAQQLGIIVKIISGDSELVSAAVGQELGLIETPNQVMNGFVWDTLTLEQKRESIATQTVFGRFLPTQKYEAIKLLQERGEIVGYIGDGVNDAPSLKLADVGISVSNGTDIAKNSSDIILLQRGLNVIVGGIHQGRAIFENVSKYLRETLTENLGNFLSIAVLSLMIPYLPMLPIQILITNLLTDLPHLAIATDTVDSDALRRPKHLALRSLLRFMILLSFISSAADITYFSIMKHLSVSTIQTGWFVFSTLAEIATIFSVRTRDLFLKGTKPSRFLTLSSVMVVVTVVAAAYIPRVAEILKLVPLPLSVLTLIITIALGYFLIFDLIKRTIYAHWPETY